MADGTVRLTPDSTGKYVDTSEITVSSTTVERQRINITDPTVAAALAEVNAKGTQAAYALAVQQYKDAGRTQVTLMLDDVANVAAEAMATMTVWKGTISSSTASYAVTAGKTLRITSMTAMVRATGATIGIVRARLRWATGAVVSTSAIALNLMASVPATSGQGSYSNTSVSDGFELPAAANVGISIVGSATTSNVTVTVTGFEY